MHGIPQYSYYYLFIGMCGLYPELWLLLHEFGHTVRVAQAAAVDNYFAGIGSCWLICGFAASQYLQGCDEKGKNPAHEHSKWYFTKDRKK